MNDTTFYYINTGITIEQGPDGMSYPFWRDVLLMVTMSVQ